MKDWNVIIGWISCAIMVSVVCVSMLIGTIKSNEADRSVATACVTSGGEWRRQTWTQTMGCFRGADQ